MSLTKLTNRPDLGLVATMLRKNFGHDWRHRWNCVLSWRVRPNIIFHQLALEGALLFIAPDAWTSTRTRLGRCSPRFLGGWNRRTPTARRTA